MSAAATLWLLLAVSTGYYNGGTTTVIARFTTQADCEKTLAKMPIGTLKPFFVEAKGAIQ